MFFFLIPIIKKKLKIRKKFWKKSQNFLWFSLIFTDFQKKFFFNFLEFFLVFIDFWKNYRKNSRIFWDFLWLLIISNFFFFNSRKNQKRSWIFQNNLCWLKKNSMRKNFSNFSVFFWFYGFLINSLPHHKSLKRQFWRISTDKHHTNYSKISLQNTLIEEYTLLESLKNPLIKLLIISSYHLLNVSQ